MEPNGEDRESEEGSEEERPDDDETGSADEEDDETEQGYFKKGGAVHVPRRSRALFCQGLAHCEPGGPAHPVAAEHRTTA